VLRTFTDVPPAPNQRDLEGTVVALLTRDHLIGTGEVVFVDLGSDAGVVPGNRLYVIRRGDAYSPVMRPGQVMGQNDPNFPARALGEIAIVQTGKSLSVGIVTMSMQEMGPGDKVVMRRSR
jgi:hypothetical protein